MLAHLLLSLPSVCAYLLVCRGSGASGKKKRNGKSLRELPIMSIENPTLAHFTPLEIDVLVLTGFRHFIRRGGFSSRFTNSPAYKAADIYVPIRHLYNCRGFSTNQLFFNKQSQFRESSNERKYLLYKGLSNFIPLAGQKNKPNSKPIKPNFQKAQMNVNLTITKDYRKKDDFIVRINKPNFQNAKNERKRFFTKGL